MHNSLFDKVTTFSQRLAARGHAQRPLNHARFKRQQGATALEYAVIAALVIAALIIVFGSSGSDGESSTGLVGVFENVFGKIDEIVDGTK
ncbi:Flp family type IVb pilin [Chromohalobacter israelensis]|uniref:Flp family type IVb pilin n=1 Tax=Chromohalobacter israelensis TaxID=141390 RepID=UPI000FFED51C|nr:Flp family type IVb pilin [Chromohalobacter salexigens]RXE48117.1 hypothetical protein B4O83_09070 [Chromohalobacter salexigens]